MIYICIPALNEARTIGVLLWKIRQVMDEFPRDYHVLVLDDGSTDDTREVLEPYLGVLPVTVLRNERTQGYPAALERLLREAVHRSTHPKRDGVVTLQADFTESPGDIPVLLKRLEGGADVVGVTVTQTEGELPRAVRWSRRGLPWLLSRAPLPKEVGDPLSGFRAYRVSVVRRALQDLPQGRPMLTKHGWAANAELLLCVLPHVRRAEGAEVSLRYTRRERPTRFRPWSTALELWDLARKAPRRLAQARAAAAAADGRAAAGQPAPPPQRPAPAPAPAPQRQHQPQRQQPAASPKAQRQGQHGGQPASQRQLQDDQTGSQRQTQQGGQAGSQRQSQQAGQPGQQRQAQGGQPASQRQPQQGTAPGQRPQREGQPPAERETQPAAQQSAPPAPPPEVVSLAPEMADELVVVSPEAPAPTKPKRRRPPRRRSSAAKAAAAAASAEAGSADVPVAESSAADTTVEPSPVDTATAATAESGDAPAPKKRSSRPRRPRRPRGSGSPPADAGAGEGEGGGTTE